MQVSTKGWTAPTGTLGRIIEDAVARAAGVRRDARALAELERAAERMPPAPAFAVALRGPGVALIAEVKRRSPSRGMINSGLSSRAQASAYAAGGAAALSVLTEPRHFGGDLSDLRNAAAAVALPVLRKDFIVDEIQLLEARANGAAAALLIVRALEPAVLPRLAAFARAQGVEPLIEAHDAAELDRALAAGGQVIGINNRNLETLDIDQVVGDRLIPRVPPDCIAISESGMRVRADVERAARAGADAVLVGSILSAAADPSEAVRALTGVPRVSRGR